MIESNAEKQVQKCNFLINPENKSYEQNKQLYCPIQITSRKKNNLIEQTSLDVLEESNSQLQGIDERITSGLEESEKKRYNLLLKSIDFSSINQENKISPIKINQKQIEISPFTFRGSIGMHQILDSNLKSVPVKINNQSQIQLKDQQFKLRANELDELNLKQSKKMEIQINDNQASTYEFHKSYQEKINNFLVNPLTELASKFKIISGNQIQFKEREQVQVNIQQSNFKPQQTFYQPKDHEQIYLNAHRSQPLQLYRQFPVILKPNQSGSLRESQRIFSQKEMNKQVNNLNQSSPQIYSIHRNKEEKIILQSKNKERKLSECSSFHSKSAEIKHQLNKISASIKADKKSSHKRKSEQNVYNDYLDERKKSLQTSQFHHEIMEVEQNAESTHPYKFGTHQNSFSNRSQKSSDSNPSKRSSYRYNRFIDTVQVPQLSILQVVRQSGGRQPRVQRRSTKGSRNSRSASTCKKSYDDLSEINMHKIQQSDCQQLQDKSIKRLKNHVHFKNQLAIELNHEILKVQIIDCQVNHRVDQQKQDFQFQYSKTLQTPANTKHQPENSQYQIHQLSYYAKQEASDWVSAENLKICPQFSEKIQKASKIIKQDKSVLAENIYIPKSIIQSPSKLSQSLKKMQNQILNTKRNKLDLSYCVITTVLEPVVSIEQQYQSILEESQHFFSLTHCKSKYQREKFQMIISRYFKILGLDLIVLNQIGLKLQHDGVFACAYIHFLKDSKLNPGMIEWMLFNNFDQEVKIYTNKQIFNQELKRVNEQREMYYENLFAYRLEELKEKIKDEVYANNIQRQVYQKDEINKQVHYSNSLISLVDSNGTVTLDGQDDAVIIKKQFLKENQINKKIENITEANEQLQNSFGDKQEQLTKSNEQMISKRKKKTTKKQKQSIKNTQTNKNNDDKRPKRRASSKVIAYFQQSSQKVIQKDEQKSKYHTQQQQRAKKNKNRILKEKPSEQSKTKQRSKSKSKNKRISKGILKPSKAIQEKDLMKNQSLSQSSSPKNKAISNRSPLKSNPSNVIITRGRNMHSKQKNEKGQREERLVRFSVNQKQGISKQQKKQQKKSRKKSQSKGYDHNKYQRKT